MGIASLLSKIELYVMLESLVEINYINVKNVLNFLSNVHTFGVMRDFRLERKHTNV